MALVLLILGLAQSAPPILITLDQLAASTSAPDSAAAATAEIEGSPGPLRAFAREVNGVELLLWTVAGLLCLAAAAALIGPRPEEAEELFWVSVLLDLCLWAALRRGAAYEPALTPGVRAAVLAALAAATGLGFAVRACAPERTAGPPSALR